MPVLKNARHEAFARYRAKGLVAIKAYLKAGYIGSRTSASRLSRKDSIVARVRELQEAVSTKFEWSEVDRLASLKKIHDTAIKKDPRTAIAAITEANKMTGTIKPTKHEVTGKNGGPVQHVDLSKLSDEQLNALEATFGPLAGTGSDDEDDQGGEEETPTGD